jgi:hypothetical protein
MSRQLTNPTVRLAGTQLVHQRDRLAIGAVFPARGVEIEPTVHRWAACSAPCTGRSRSGAHRLDSDQPARRPTAWSPRHCSPDPTTPVRRHRLHRGGQPNGSARSMRCSFGTAARTDPTTRSASSTEPVSHREQLRQLAILKLHLQRSVISTRSAQRRQRFSIHVDWTTQPQLASVVDVPPTGAHGP